MAHPAMAEQLFDVLITEYQKFFDQFKPHVESMIRLKTSKSKRDEEARLTEIKILNFIEKVMDLIFGKMRQHVIEAYRNDFTDEEIEGIIGIITSTLYQKWQLNMAVANQKLFVLLMGMENELVPQIEKMFEEIIGEEGE